MLTIHGVLISVHTRKVVIVAVEMGIPYKNVPVIPFNPTKIRGELSPIGKIPVAETDGKGLRDSTLICQYLEKQRSGKALYLQRNRDWQGGRDALTGRKL